MGEARPPWRKARQGQKGLDVSGWCEEHQKALFQSRKQARKRRWNGAELTPYRCDAVEGMWHLGHLPPHVKNGAFERWH